jgi:putative SOS response-associated peptidase YedK
MQCARCKTPNDVDLAAMEHPPTTFVHDLASRLRCRKCAKAGRRPSATLLQLARQPRHPARKTDMCNLSNTTNQAAIIALFRVANRYVGNLAPMPGGFPDYKARIVRSGLEGRELAVARWGTPSSQQALMEATKKRAAKLEAKGKPVDFKELLRMEPDGGTTNIRNMKSKHWARWLGVENCCVVPFNSFSEFYKPEGGDIWFALDETRPLACFAGIWTNWTSVRKVKEGETTNEIFAFLTTEPNAEVGAIHPKATPVILTTPDEVETWMTAPPDEALQLQRPLPDGSLRIVARGVKEDPAGPIA